MKNDEIGTLLERKKKMISQISFCINTSINERFHVELLFRSLNQNLCRKDHEILVYVENDNQDTVGFLKTQKEIFPNLKIVVNPLPIPLGYARNINLMFEMATHEIVSYLQSDQVICHQYDLEVLKHLNEHNIISSTRIEPPLHPPSPEKITHDFGLDPQKFDLDVFTRFAESKKTDRITDYWFAPFTLYKKNWVSIGGHDTLFRRSREDSDLLYRFCLQGLKMKQCWSAIVYHFTCTSSRGKEWWKPENQRRTQLQSVADQVEMQRFLRKWKRFKHEAVDDPQTNYKYNISVNLKNCMPVQATGIFSMYHLFEKIFIDEPQTRQMAKDRYQKLHNPANEILNISDKQWAEFGKYYRVWNVEDIFSDAPVEDDIVLEIDMNTMTPELYKYLQQMNDIIHSYKDELTPGDEFDCEGIKIKVNRIQNVIEENVVVKNPPLDIELIRL